MEDFEVEERPSYTPRGEGEHLYLWIEKRDTSGVMLRRMLASGLGVPPRDIGMAGLKDRRAVTRQWVSVPARAEERVGGLDGPRLRVLAAERHGNKLRTGHLRGNDFRIVVRGTVGSAVERAEAKLGALASGGMPNFYGSQRMGRGGSTLAAGWALSRGERRRARVAFPDGTVHQINLRDRQLTRLAASALQSEVFNRVVALRLSRGLLDRVLPGDLCRKRDTGGSFVTDDPAREQARLERGELVITGPMWGPKMPRPAGEAAELEREALAEAGLDDEAFRRIGHLAAGTRRPLLVWPAETRVDAEGEDAVAVRFGLPAGSFASVLVHELVGPLSAAEAERYAAPPIAPGQTAILKENAPCA